jgi:hypothetical protein
MEKNMKRAERRSQKERMSRKVSKRIDHTFRDPSHWWPEFEQWKEDYVRRHADNRKKCSCHMCCNPRRLGDLTIQEKKISQREKFCQES